MTKQTQEIERKWLVQDLPVLEKLKREQIIQGCLAISSAGTEVRIRRKGEKCFETVKNQEFFLSMVRPSNRRLFAQDAQKGRSARPQRAKRRGVRFGTLSL